jgi:hypothetical protein
LKENINKKKKRDKAHQGYSNPFERGSTTRRFTFS